MTKVLMYEGVDGHGECLPSYYFYFKELGYDVEFIIKTKLANEQALWMLDKVPTYIISAPIHKPAHFKEIKSKVHNLFKYDLYFITTLNKHTYEFVKLLYKNGIPRNKIIFQCHLNYNYYLEQTKHDMYLNQNGFVLGNDDQKVFPKLSPIKSIPNFEHPDIIKNYKKEATLLIGGLSHIHFKNFEKFIQAVEELNSEGYNIKINVTGIRELGNYILPKSPCINYLGRLNFKDMAKQYIENDFLFVLFDEYALTCLDDHHSFLKGRVSGSKNMSIIYKIPLVAQKPFQKAWDLDDTNSISYEGHEYKQVLIDLLKTKKETYNSIKKALYEREKAETDISMQNLKDKLAFVTALPAAKYPNCIPALTLRHRSPIKKSNYIHY